MATHHVTLELANQLNGSGIGEILFSDFRLGLCRMNAQMSHVKVIRFRSVRTLGTAKRARWNGRAFFLIFSSPLIFPRGRSFQFFPGRVHNALVLLQKLFFESLIGAFVTWDRVFAGVMKRVVMFETGFSGGRVRALVAPMYLHVGIGLMISHMTLKLGLSDRSECADSAIELDWTLLIGGGAFGVARNRCGEIGILWSYWF